MWVEQIALNKQWIQKTHKALKQDADGFCLFVCFVEGRKSSSLFSSELSPKLQHNAETEQNPVHSPWRSDEQVRLFSLSSSCGDSNRWRRESLEKASGGRGGGCLHWMCALACFILNSFVAVKMCRCSENKLVYKLSQRERTVWCFAAKRLSCLHCKYKIWSDRLLNLQSDSSKNTTTTVHALDKHYRYCRARNILHRGAYFHVKSSSLEKWPSFTAESFQVTQHQFLKSSGISGYSLHKHLQTSRCSCCFCACRRESTV